MRSACMPPPEMIWLYYWRPIHHAPHPNPSTITGPLCPRLTWLASWFCQLKLFHQTGQQLPVPVRADRGLVLVGAGRLDKLLKLLQNPGTPCPSTLNPKSQHLHPAPYTLHPTPYTQPTPYTLHPSPYTLNPKPDTLKPGS